jgi:hypothetical protein
MKAGRILAGLCLGPVAGSLAAIPFAFAIDAAYGAEVTGGQWHLTIPNIIYSGIMGLLTGLFAGIIAGRVGWLIGALAQFIPLALLTLAAVIRNRDFLSMSEVPPATWTWIGLLPAVVGGHLGERTLTYRAATQAARDLELYGGVDVDQPVPENAPPVAVEGPIEGGQPARDVFDEVAGQPVERTGCEGVP